VSDTSSTIATVMAAVAAGADLAAPALPEPGALVARLVGALLRFGADMVKHSKDPVAEITRVHSEHALLAAAQAEFAALLRAKPGAPSDR
jgi:hypothetical protein